MAGFRLPMSLKDAAKIYIIFKSANFLLENHFISCIFYVFVQIYRKLTDLSNLVHYKNNKHVI